VTTPTERLTEAPGELRRLPNGGARYYDAEQIVSHLNYALGATGWDWAVLEYGINVEDDEVWALGQLTARMLVPSADGDAWQQTVKSERGYQSIGRKRDGSIISMGDSYKGAASDSLKRCARLLGVGLDAWAKDVPAANGASQPTQQPQGRPTAPPQPRQQPAATEIPLADRPTLLALYAERLESALAIGFRASWTTSDPAKLTDVQLSKYAEIAGNYVARNATPASREGAA
jgi:hypothetical protein